MSPAARLVARRLLYAAVTLLVVSATLFAFVEVLPGDAASRSLGQYASDEQVDAFRHEHGLDRAVPVRYLSWLSGGLRGDLGDSLISESSVSDVIGARVGNTLFLAGFSLVVVTLAAFGLGLWTGSRPGSRVDTLVSGATSVVVALPEFVTASLLITLFSWRLGWFPPLLVVGPGDSIFTEPAGLVLPLASVILISVAWATRLIRAVVVDAGALPHVEAARLQGVPERSVLRRHLLPSILGPSAQVVAFLVPYLVGGTLVVEVIFNYPGLSQVLLNAVMTRDAPVVEGVGMLYAGGTIVAFLVADVVGVLANPRLRVGSS